MDFSYRDRHDSVYGRPDIDSHPPVNHTTRSWSNNGVYYTVETASYSSPGMLFEVNGGAANSMFPQAQQPARSQGPGLLGTAFGLLGDVLAAKQQAATQESARRAARQSYVDDLAYGSDEYGQVREQRSNRPRSFISSLADRLLSSQQQRARRKPRSREESPARQGSNRARGNAMATPYHTQEHKPSWTRGHAARIDDATDEEDEDQDEYERLYGPKPRRAFTTNDASLIAALENAAEHHRKQARDCRARIQAASRQTMVSASMLEHLVNELKGHESAYENALQNLSMAKAGNGTSQRQAPHPALPYQQRRRSQRAHYHDFTQAHPGFSDFFQARPSNHAAFAEPDNFDDMFGPFAGTPFAGFHSLFSEFGTRSPLEDAFFAVPSATFSFGTGQHRRPRTSRANTGPQYQQPSGFATFSAAPQTPPATLLKSDEAGRLFKIYNGRWNNLAPTDPNIPYPARGLKPAALTTRDSLWAPTVSSPIATWSEENVMQANAQAFFLGAVGLSPQYSEAPGTGRVVMGYNKAQASAAQVKNLVDLLKKEKVRWHSDRLGRRNGGGLTGPNQALQCDEKARAVFHSVYLRSVEMTKVSMAYQGPLQKHTSPQLKTAGKQPTLRPKSTAHQQTIQDVMRPQTLSKACSTVPKKKATERPKPAHRMVTRSRAQQTFRFMALPPEIREKIYSMTFSTLAPHTLTLGSLQLPPPLSVSRVVRSEAMSTFFAVGTFSKTLRSNWCVRNKHFHGPGYYRHRAAGVLSLSPLLQDGERGLPKEAIRFRHVQFRVDCVCCLPGIEIGSLSLRVVGGVPAVERTVKAEQSEAKKALGAMFESVEVVASQTAGREVFNGFTVDDLLRVAGCFRIEDEETCPDYWL
ncbi:CorA metal ion transporter [Vermiconidia calcicola]|uniref:CorA metal ion transporter n=1 Tax=Vermiconidia calcicola TaxID=1690605 RepID=A0ACC3N170_9PEZI|nr:CorA metal ion transporter [Vermiconidia calcicola]